MNVVAIYKDINFITEYDAERIRQLVLIYAEQTCIHRPKDFLRHDISILLLMYILVSAGEDVRHLTMKSCAKWQNFLRKKNTYANAGISTRFLTVSPAAMISLP